MSDLARSGHNAIVEIELEPIVAGTFTTIGELQGDIPWSLLRNTADGSAHGEKVDSTVTSPLQRREPASMVVNHAFGSTTHSITTGLQAHFSNNTLFGIRFAWPDAAPGVDEIICSARVSAIQRLAPLDAGTYKLNFTVMPTGPFIIDGVTEAL